MTLDPARFVAFDTETHLIQPGLASPPLVCGSVAVLSEGKIQGTILNRDDTLDVFKRLIASDRILVGANIPYDLLVCAYEWNQRGYDAVTPIFAKLDRGEVWDIQLGEALHAIAEGHLGRSPDGGPLINPDTGKQTTRYSLATCVELVLGRTNAKANDRWRKSYALLEDIPIEEWPADARIYPIDDAVNTLEVALAQHGLWPRGDGTKWESRNLHDQSRQVYAAFCMTLGAAWGFAIDGEAVDELEREVTEERAKNLEMFISAGFFKLKDGRPEVSAKTGAEKKNTVLIKSMLARAYGCTGECVTCGGCGQVPGQTKCKPCGGSGRTDDAWEPPPGVTYTPSTAAPEDVACVSCNGVGKVDHPKNKKHCPGCGGTGIDLDSASVPQTPTGDVAAGRDPLSESGDEMLMAFADFSEKDKLRTTYIPFLKSGLDA
jgi:hypothetical protein